MDQKPTVGRIVHFYDHALHKPFGSGPYNGQGAGPYAAIVTQTFEDGPHINIKVLPPFHEPFDEGSVPEKDGVLSRYWEWPPRA